MLSAEEMCAFVERGYIIKRGLIADNSLESAIDRLWDFLPSRFGRHQPWTWRGKLCDCDGNKGIRERRGRFKLREEIWFEPAWNEMLPLDPRVHAVAEALLGRGQVEPTERIRGIYPIFPAWLLRRAKPSGHIDRHIYQIGVIAYLADVKPGGGGFTVWPGSHRLFFNHFTTHVGIEPSPTLQAQLDRNKKRVSDSVELHGQRGDVIFFHQRLMHAAGRNRRLAVRYAMLAEYRCRDWQAAADDTDLSQMWRYWRGVSQLGEPSETAPSGVGVGTGIR